MSSDAPPSRLKIFAVVVFYIIAAILMVTVNKWVLISVPVPAFLITCQMAIAVVLLYICHLFGLVTIPVHSVSTIRSLRPLIATNVVGLLLNTICLQYVDASFYQVARGLVLPFTVGIALITKQGIPSPRAVICCAFITFAFVIGVFSDSAASHKLASVTLIGVFSGVASSLMSAIHAVLIKRSLGLVENSSIHLAWYTNLLSMFVMVPIIVALGEVPTILDLGNEQTGLRTFVTGTVVTGIFGFLICVAGFLSIQVTSPVTHMVSSAARGVIQTVVSVIAFGDVVNGGRATSISMIMLGGMAYVWIKNQEQLARTAATTTKDDGTEEETVPLVEVDAFLEANPDMDESQTVVGEMTGTHTQADPGPTEEGKAERIEST